MTPPNQCPSFTHWVNTYIEHFRIAIVDSRGKAPALGKGWQTTASNDPAVVLTQAQDHADCNLGIMLGEEYEPGLYYHQIDCDYRANGRSGYRKLIQALRIVLPKYATNPHGCVPSAYTHDGHHTGVLLPFQVHGEVELFPGITLRGMGLYQIVEPSIHPKGTEYVWRDRGPIRLTASQVNTLKARVPLAQTSFKPTNIVRSREVGPVSRPYKKLRTQQPATRTILETLHTRWPILLPGTRNGLSCSVAWHLVKGLELPYEEARDIAKEWLLTYQGVFKTPVQRAIQDLCYVIRSAIKAKAKPGRGLWSQLLSAGPLSARSYKKLRVKTKQEQAFADAVVAEILYHILEKNTTGIEFTREQIRTIVFSTHGEYFGLDNNGIYDRQVKKFIGQAEELYVAWSRQRSYAAREASKCSWLVRVKTGKKADGEVYPSAFELGEGFLDWMLDQLFGREATEGHETHHEPDPAESPAPGPGTPPKTREGPPDASRAEEGERCPRGPRAPSV